MQAAQRSDIEGFMVMDVMRAADAKEQAGERIIHMEVGQPGTPAPKVARDAVAATLAQHNLGYTLALGNHALRERICQHYQDSYGVEIPASRIIITPGSSGAFILAFTGLFDAGATVGLPSPGYPCYRQILKALDLAPALIETSEADRWMPTPHSLQQTHARSALSGLLVASPANPTGTMIEPDRLAALCQTCERLGVWFISDEIYHGLTYDQPARTALAYSDEAIVINSFSKYFSMTGWRVGWMVVPERLVRVFERLAQNLFICAPAVSQVAALASFDAVEELEANKQTYAQNRALLLRELPKAGFTRIVPADGAFYLYCDISDLADDSAAFARRILDEAGVALTPGIDFDPVRGHRYLRFSYARSTDDIAEAARRLIQWAETNPKC
ncbi:MAG: aminotransferase class I/II-fold pyridoxal phosphate-dependent enzyme [Alphaproteobacteria bacterium]|nr:aminotransferase class I/II-fold pyridoxal phosphate-dependent enzyme [Alphaproteobacteria bacterium]